MGYTLGAHKCFTQLSNPLLKEKGNKLDLELFLNLDGCAIGLERILLTGANGVFSTIFDSIF